jgi:hypothetical protein
VALVRRVGRPALPPGIDLSLERHSLAAAGFLASAARGETISFQERPPRYQVARSLTVQRAKRTLEVVTLNVSEGGLAVRWPEALPLVGDTVTLKLKDGLFGADLEAIVCWNQPGAERERTVGLKVRLEGRGGRAWRKLVEAAARTGGRIA